MKEDRLQLRVDPALKKQVLLVARRRHTTLSALMTVLLQRLVETDLLEQQAGNGAEAEQV